MGCKMQPKRDYFEADKPYHVWLREILQNKLKNERILVTGGTGFLGRKLIHRLLNWGAQYIRILSRDEHKQEYMATMRFFDYKDKLRYILGDVRDRDTLTSAMRDINTVFHLAALKSIPQLEYAPLESVKTNITGTENVIRAAIANQVQRVIYTSSDKAVSPMNVYGATKAVAEKLIVRANVLTKDTKFACTRYGNVLGSTGSVVLKFLEQIKQDVGRLEITDPTMTRFILTGDQAAETLMTAYQFMEGGEIFLRKCPSLNIMTLAKAMCPDCEQVELGRRPGEKRHEVLISAEEMTRTIPITPDYLVVLPFPKIRGEDEYFWLYPEKPLQESRYSSNNNKFLTEEEMVTLLKEQGF